MTPNEVEQLAQQLFARMVTQPGKQHTTVGEARQLAEQAFQFASEFRDVAHKQPGGGS